jgi:hypothetical protein
MMTILPPYTIENAQLFTKLQFQTLAVSMSKVHKWPLVRFVPCLLVG